MKRPMAFRHWYAGDCRRQIDEFLEGYTPPQDAAPVHAALVPHAGWYYSGRVAARTIRAVAESSPDDLLLLSAVHRAVLDTPAVFPEGEWETPLGAIQVDDELASRILDEGAEFVLADPQAHADEHALEVQLPIIRRLMPEVRIVPILTPPDKVALRLGALLSRVAGTRNIAAIASSDLTHYGDPYGFTPAGRGVEAHQWVRSNDRRMLDLALELDAEDIVDEARVHHNACGPGALAAAVAYARERGAKRGLVIEYTDSHEVAGEKGAFQMAVGYGGLVFC